MATTNRAQLVQIEKTRRVTDQRRNMPPTQKHRPALTFGILGTVYGISPEGVVQYFDYDWLRALRFAGVTNSRDELRPGLDLRYGSARTPYVLPGYDMWNPERKVSKGQKAYWVLREEQ